MSSVSYTAVILDDKSRSILATAFKDLMPDGWEWIAHHMTIKMGQLPEDQRKEMLGQKVTLKINKVANNDMVMAIGVTGFYCEKKIPHITLAVNRAAGAKPYMSDKLTDWYPYNVNFDLTGIVKEMENPTQKMTEKKA